MNFVTELLLALIVPTITLFVGAFAKKIASKSRWAEDNFFLGIQLSISSISLNLAYLLETIKDHLSNPGTHASFDEKITFGLIFLVSTFVSLLWIISLHQDWQLEPPSTERTRNLIGYCNGLGGGLIFIFLIWRSIFQNFHPTVAVVVVGFFGIPLLVLVGRYFWKRPRTVAVLSLNLSGISKLPRERLMEDLAPGEDEISIE